MENQTRTEIPAKKQWQKPDFQILDTSDINSGVNFQFHEGMADPVKVGNHTSAGPSSQYHS